MSAQPITGFHQDEARHWIASLACGHTQHVRHDPPWQLRPWVVTPQGRAAMLGRTLRCKLCDAAESSAATTASGHGAA
ncbi:DUF3565 domain-containing protein [Terriglobus sp.]|uniref:DUF3565 domain-containing protein n=1 Tax=Terriglobus sp. TaxID=1889013 RepID=UPI003B0069C3